MNLTGNTIPRGFRSNWLPEADCVRTCVIFGP